MAVATPSNHIMHQQRQRQEQLSTTMPPSHSKGSTSMARERAKRPLASCSKSDPYSTGIFDGHLGGAARFRKRKGCHRSCGQACARAAACCAFVCCAVCATSPSPNSQPHEHDRRQNGQTTQAAISLKTRKHENTGPPNRAQNTKTRKHENTKTHSGGRLVTLHGPEKILTGRNVTGPTNFGTRKR